MGCVFHSLAFAAEGADHTGHRLIKSTVIGKSHMYTTMVIDVHRLGAAASERCILLSTYNCGLFMFFFFVFFVIK